MTSWRLTRLLLPVAAGAVATSLSIHSPHAQAQPAGSGSAAAAADPSDDDDNGAGSGSGGVLVAPLDPKARIAWLAERFAVATASRPTLGRARIAYAATDLSTGTELLAGNADTKLNLASNAKVLTTAAALGGLGGGFRWRTAVFVVEPPDDAGTIAGDLYVRGRGDPLLSIAAMRQLAADVAARGVKTIEGKLIVDATYFDDQVEPPHFDEQPKERAAFRAPVASFGVNRSSYTITVMAEPGGGARITLDPVTDHIKLTKTEVVSVPTGRTRLKVESKVKRDTIEVEITGHIREGEGSWDLRRRVDDPARFAAEVFRKALADHGVRIKGRVLGRDVVPLNALEVAHHDSAPLLEVARMMNKTSDNYVAECIVKTLGAELKTTQGPATWADGLAAVKAQLVRFGLTADTYRFENGSGLYASTEVSPRHLLALFANAHADYRIGPDLLASLPVGGYDGTLAKRWHGKPAQGRVRAKTGTLDKVTTLAGYIAVDSRRVVAFAIIVNDIPAGQRNAVRAMVDDMVESLAAYVGAR